MLVLRSEKNKILFLYLQPGQSLSYILIGLRSQQPRKLNFEIGDLAETSPPWQFFESLSGGSIQIFPNIWNFSSKCDWRSKRAVCLNILLITCFYHSLLWRKLWCALLNTSTTFSCLSSHFMVYKCWHVGTSTTVIHNLISCLHMYVVIFVLSWSSLSQMIHLSGQTSCLYEHPSLLDFTNLSRTADFSGFPDPWSPIFPYVLSSTVPFYCAGVELQACSSICFLCLNTFDTGIARFLGGSTDFGMNKTFSSHTRAIQIHMKEVGDPDNRFWKCKTILPVATADKLLYRCSISVH